MRTKAASVDRLLGEASRYLEQLSRGTVLSVDPSSGSENSQPGFALFQAARFIKSGTIRVTPGTHPAQRYREVLRGMDELRKTHPFDLLIVEKLPLIMGSGKMQFNQQAVVNLHRSVGVIMAGADCDRVLEVAPATWHAWLRSIGKEDEYIKNDQNDATVLALTVFSKVGIQSELRPELFGARKPTVSTRRKS